MLEAGASYVITVWPRASFEILPGFSWNTRSNHTSLHWVCCVLPPCFYSTLCCNHIFSLTATMSSEWGHIVEVVSSASGNAIKNLSNEIPRDSRKLIHRGHYCDVYQAQWKKSGVDAGVDADVVTASHYEALLESNRSFHDASPKVCLKILIPQPMDPPSEERARAKLTRVSIFQARFEVTC